MSDVPEELPGAEVEAEAWLSENPPDPNNPFHASAVRRKELGDKVHRWQPGLSGNPSGKSNNRPLVDMLRAEIAAVDFRAPPSDDPSRANEVVTIARSIARRLVNIVLMGRDRDSIEAAKLLFAYIEGMPVQPIEFDVSKVVMEIATARGLDSEDTKRALDETRRILNAAKNGQAIMQ